MRLTFNYAMKFSITSALAFASFFGASSAAFSASGNSNVVLYWGQNSGQNQQSLGEYCQSTAADMYVISFLNSFPTTSLNIVSCYSTFDGSDLLHCPDIAADIKTCQSLGKKVLLSLGGAVGSYGFSSNSDAEDYAVTLWNMFGGGSADQRPFDDAIVDGFDLDIENNNSVGYAALSTKLRELFNGGDYYISAAPQCVFPDANVGDALANSYIDFAFVQFYNNPCGVDRGSGFNWDTWKDYATNISPNKNIKIYLGIPASSTAAGSGYSSVADISTILSNIGSDANFGGVMMWDASQAFGNILSSGESYAVAMKAALDNAEDSGAVVATSSPQAVSSTFSYQTSTAVVDNGQWYPDTTSAVSTSSPVVVVSTSSAIADDGQWHPDTPVAQSSTESTSTPVALTTSTYIPQETTVAETTVELATSSSSSVNNGQWANDVQTSSAATSTAEPVVESTVVVIASSSSSVNNGQWVNEAQTSSAAVSTVEFVAPSSSSSVDNGQWVGGAQTSSSTEAPTVVTVGETSTVAGVDTIAAQETSTVAPTTVSTSTVSSIDNGHWVNDVSTSSAPAVTSTSSTPDGTADATDIVYVTAPAQIVTYDGTTWVTKIVDGIPTGAGVAGEVVNKQKVDTVSSVSASSTELYDVAAIETGMVSAVSSSSTSSHLTTTMYVTVVSHITTRLSGEPLTVVTTRSVSNSSFVAGLPSTVYAQASSSSGLSAPATLEDNYNSTSTVVFTPIVYSTSSFTLSSAAAFSSAATSAASIVSSASASAASASSASSASSAASVASASSSARAVVSAAVATATSTVDSGTGSVIDASKVQGDCSGKIGKDLALCINTNFVANKTVELPAESAVASSAVQSQLSTAGVKQISLTSTVTTVTRTNGVVITTTIPVAVTVTATVTDAAASSSTAASSTSAAPISVSTDDPLACTTESSVTCIDGKFALCNFNRWVLFACPMTTICSAKDLNGYNVVVGCNYEYIVQAELAEASASAAALLAASPTSDAAQASSTSDARSKRGLVGIGRGLGGHHAHINMHQKV